MIYLDSSALMKLVRQEEEGTALGGWLAEHTEEPEVSSELGRSRSCERHDGSATGSWRRLGQWSTNSI